MVFPTGMAPPTGMLGSLCRAAGKGTGLPSHPATQDLVTASGLCVWKGHIVSEEDHGVNKPGSKMIPCALVTHLGRIQKG